MTDADIVAGEILYRVAELEKEYKDHPKALEALQKVKDLAREIKKAGESGWY
jgi:hypothetical protein